MLSSRLHRPSLMSPCSQNAQHRKCDPAQGCRLLRLHPRPVLMASVIAKVHWLGMKNPYLPKPPKRGVSLDRRREKLGTMEIRIHPRIHRLPQPLRLSPLPLSLLRRSPPDVLGARVKFLRRRVMSTVTSIPFKLRRTSVGRRIGIE